MIRLLFVLYLLLSSVSLSFSQGWAGFQSGLYSGISSANMRPGGMASSPFKADATVLGIHLYTQTENMFKNSDAIGMISSGGLKGLAGINQLKASSSMIQSNLQLPSVLVGINPKWSVAFSWNMRFMWSSKIGDTRLTDIFDKGPVDINSNEEVVLSSLNSWNEFGAGVGGIVWQKPHHTVTAGGFFKLTFGTSNLDVNIDGLDIKAQDSVIEHMDLNLNVRISEQTYNLIDQGDLKLLGRVGVGFDIGAEYRYNKEERKSPYDYLFKVGFAINDAGYMRYKSGLTYSEVNISAENLSVDRFRDFNSLREAIDTLSAIFDVEKKTVDAYGVKLPLSFRVYGDYNFPKHLSLYSDFNFLFIKLMNPAANKSIYFSYTLTPRYEDKQFGVYMPVTLTNYVPANVGVALRWKPFIIGSSNIFTYWAYKNNGKFLDLFLKVKIPVLYREERVYYLKKNKKKHEIPASPVNPE